MQGARDATSNRPDGCHVHNIWADSIGNDADAVPCRNTVRDEAPRGDGNYMHSNHHNVKTRAKLLCWQPTGLAWPGCSPAWRCSMGIYAYICISQQPSSLCTAGASSCGQACMHAAAAALVYRGCLLRIRGSVQQVLVTTCTTAPGVPSVQASVLAPRDEAGAMRSRAQAGQGCDVALVGTGPAPGGLCAPQAPHCQVAAAVPCCDAACRRAAHLHMQFEHS